MARQVKVAAGRLWGYVAVVVAVTALARGYWRPWPDIDASGAEIGTSAYREPNGWYWVSPGQVISCMMSESETAGVYDKDTEYDDESGQQIQVAPGNINLNSMRWEQTGGLWVLEGNNNNSPDSEAYGQTVYWTPGEGQTYGCIRFASVDDETDDEDRDDNELEVLNTYKGFHVFRINGPDELWYWGYPADVDLLDYNMEVPYSVPLGNSSGHYEWIATGVVMQQNENDMWRDHIAGTGINWVWVRPQGKFDGLVRVKYQYGLLEAQKAITVRYPNRVVGINWASYPWIINGQFRRPFDPNRQVGKHYDENPNQFNSPGWENAGEGFFTLIGYHLQDQMNQNVPYWYCYQEFFTDTNERRGHRLWNDPSENWGTAPYVNDNSWGSRGQSGYTMNTSNIWHDMVSLQDLDWYVPHVQCPQMPSRNGAEVQYVLGKWTFGSFPEAMSTVFTWDCNWVDCVDCGRHNSN